AVGPSPPPERAVRLTRRAGRGNAPPGRVNALTGLPGAPSPTHMVGDNGRRARAPRVRAGPAPGLDRLLISFTRFICTCGQRDDARRLTRLFALTGTGVRAAGVGYAPAKFEAAPLHGPDR